MNPDKQLLRALKENAEKITDSAIFLALFNRDMTDEWVPVMQMGLAVYLNKPIFFLVRKSEEHLVPENLRRLARFCETWDDSLPEPLAKSAFEAASTRLIQHAREEGFF